MKSSFAERLRWAMTQAGMNQVMLAEKTGASRAAICQYLAGKNIPGTERMKALAAATDVDFEDLTGEESEAARRLVVKKISVREAARCLGKSDQFVRVGIRGGQLSFGKAVPGTGQKWNYYINPAKFRDFVGEEQFDAFFGLLA